MWGHRMSVCVSARVNVLTFVSLADGLYSYGLSSHGLYGYGLSSYALYSYGL